MGAGAAIGATSWAPTDNDAKGFHAAKNLVAVNYQFRIEFFQFPKSTEFFIAPDSSWKMKDLKTGKVSQASVPHSKPVKVLTFKNHISVFPRNWLKYKGDNLLVCTNLNSTYAPSTAKEREKVRSLGHTYGMPWKNAKGEIEKFCGIVDLKGNQLFQFPVKEHEPDVLIQPLDIIGDGKRAAILLGRERTEEGEDVESVRFVGDFYEAVIWDYPKSIRRVPLKPGFPDHVWYQKFVNGEL